MKKISKLFLVALVVIATLVVTASSVFAANVETTKPFNQGDDPAACLESAVEASKSAPVKVVLGADMVFENDTTVSKAVGNIAIESELNEDGTPKYSIIFKKGASVTLNGNYEFKNIGIYAEKTDVDVWEKDFFDTGFYFLSGASGTFVENISTPTDNENIRGIDIEGNATIKAGTYYTIFGNGNLTIDGGTFGGRVFGGYMVDTTENNNNVNMTINGGTFKGAVLGGSLITGGGSYSGNVNMTIKNGEFKSSIFGGSLIKATPGGKHSGKITFAIEDGTFGYIYGGSSMSVAEAEQSGETELTIKGGTVATYVYGASVLYNGAIHSGAAKTTVDGGTFEGSICGSSSISMGTHSGNVDVIINGGSFFEFINGVGSKGELGKDVVVAFKINGGDFTYACSINQADVLDETNTPAKASIDFSGWTGEKRALAYANDIITDITEIIYPEGVTADELAEILEQPEETTPVDTQPEETTPVETEEEATNAPAGEESTKAPANETVAPDSDNESGNSTVIVIVGVVAVVVIAAVVAAVAIKKKKSAK